MLVILEVLFPTFHMLCHIIRISEPEIEEAAGRQDNYMRGFIFLS
jgi:hypothetical protein